ncbi:N-acetylglutamate synthase [Tenacibaculum sp. 190524A02b]|uniref:N-acetylglutamate synthase n=1 Tax=Tenacibaculum vairaonense TaxID=3137860 RepID=A0ABP1FE89_9FLAO
MNYHNKKFRPLYNSGNGEVSSDMIFHYQQEKNILTCEYEGQHILKGHLIGKVSDDGVIDMRYHQINKQGELMTGTCTSTPEVGTNGKIKLYEEWQWTSGNKSKGSSVLEEI